MDQNQNATTAPAGGYGYASDEVKQSTFGFGGNFGKTFLKKFEWIGNAGKDGAEGEALDIVFNINGTDKNYRVFPVSKAYGENNVEITDPNAQEFRDAISDLNARVTHILHAFLDSESIKAGFGRPINSFKEFCQVAMSLLPKNYTEVPLDIFLQYQWNISEGQPVTYLEIPRKMKQGKWLSPAIPAVGSWKENRADNIDGNTVKAIWYTDDAGNEHPFFKNGWFMLSNYGKQQKASGAEETQQAATATQTAGAAQKSAW